MLTSNSGSLVLRFGVKILLRDRYVPYPTMFLLKLKKEKVVNYVDNQTWVQFTSVDLMVSCWLDERPTGLQWEIVTFVNMQKATEGKWEIGCVQVSLEHEENFLSDPESPCPFVKPDFHILNIVFTVKCRLGSISGPVNCWSKKKTQKSVASHLLGVSNILVHKGFWMFSS